MQGIWKRVVMAGVMAGGLVLGLGAGGCSNNKQAEAEAAAESSELRQKNAQLEQSLRERDATIAELQKSQQQQAVMATPPSNSFDSTPRNTGGSQGMNEGKKWTIAGDLLFGPGSADLKSGSKKSLDKIVAELKSSKYSGYNVRVDGYTDSDPIKKSKWGSNDALSEARARSVEKYLESKGISSSRLSAVGHGSANPKKTKAESRRVEIVVLN